MTPSSVSENHGRSRLDRLRLLFSQASADVLLVSSLPNIRYLSGFAGSAALLLLEGQRATLFTDSRYTFQAREELANSPIRLQIARQGLFQAAAAALRKRRGRTRVAYNPIQLSVSQKLALDSAAGPRIRWVRAAPLVERLRVIKDASEIAVMRDAAILISDVFLGVLPRVRAGVTELALAAEIEFAMKLRGASGAAFDTIVASGPRSAWAHAHPSPKPLGKNELVVLDQGAILRGYCSDLTRTVFLGRSSDKVRRIYRAVLEAQQAAKSAVRPGVAASEIDAAARRVLKQYGLERFFTHSTGHGLGIEVHEMPRLAKKEAFLLEEGMVITIEPGAYIEGLGGVRIEDDVLVTASGHSELTTAPRDFLEL
ncbi:MAG: Xaa-Pro peptidase family protein [Candidatus Acidiferrales bacterium]